MTADTTRRVNAAGRAEIMNWLFDTKLDATDLEDWVNVAEDAASHAALGEPVILSMLWDQTATGYDATLSLSDAHFDSEVEP